MDITNKDLKDLKSSSKQVMERSFNDIYQEYKLLVYFVSFDILKNQEDAKDITNETFMQFFINKNKIRNYKKIKYYLLTTCKNLSINLLKKNNKYEQLDNEIACFDQKNEFNAYIDKFKEYLNEEELELIIYKFLYDFTFKDIAKEKGVSIDSISSKYKRTLDKVKKHYKGEDNE